MSESAPDFDRIRSWTGPVALWNAVPVRAYAHHVVGEVRARMGALASLRDVTFRRDAIDEALFLSPNHFLTVPAINWITPTEPQLTKAICNIVLEKDDHFSARMDAVLRALGVDPGPEPNYDAATIEAEAPAVNRMRLDLLIEWSDSEGLRRAVVEAKVGHCLTKDQLEVYYKAASKGLGKDKEPDCVILQLSPDPPPMHHCQCDRWITVSWASFLINLEKHLHSERGVDDEAFRVFRRITWSRVDRLKQGDRS